ncbi:hypothetical protein IPF86_01735 [Candidatus Nomurabacteria bacterium]|nr:MAG: hypothetical protein IPF86_01735 [Candidatus Nomurabacteria bacterium]
MKWTHYIVQHPVDWTNEVHVCPGVQLALQVNIVPAQTYQTDNVVWSTGVNSQYLEPVIEEGAYFYTLTNPNNGCVYTSQTVFVYKDAFPDEQEATVSNNSNLLTVDNASAFETIRWMRNGSFLMKPDGTVITGPTYKMKRTGTYWAFATEGGCDVSSQQFYYLNNGVMLHSVAELDLSEDESIVMIVDRMGVQMRTDGSNLQNGQLYFVIIQSSTGIEKVPILKE